MSSMIEYFNTCAFYGKFNVTYTWTGDGARALSKQWWTAAVRDVAQGVADIGISDFYFTAERAAMAPFTMPIGRDPLMLWVPRPVVDKTLTTLVMKPLKPFHGDLWLALLVIACVSCLLDAHWSPQPRATVQAQGDQTLLQKVRGRVQCFGRRLANTTIVGGGGGDKSAAQLVLGFGWACIVFMVSTGYTANLASILVRVDVDDYITSLDDAIDKGVIICGIDSVMADLIVRFPRVKSYIRPINYSAPIYDEFISVGCNVIIYSLQEAKRRPKAILQPLCKLNLVPVEEVTSVMVSWPVSNHMMASLSYWVQYTYKETGGKYYNIPYYTIL